jgi:hypothetical protein
MVKHNLICTVYLYIVIDIDIGIYIFNCKLVWHPLAVVQYTFTHKQYTEYRERNIHNNQRLTDLGSAGLAPSLTSYTLAFALQLRKKHGKPSVRVAARTSQAHTVQYKNNAQYNTQKKNSNTE